MYRGDIALGSTIDIKFTTRRFSTGAPFTLAGTPAVSAYVDNGTTEITAGVTLSVDFDGRTGLNNVRVVATSGNGFATGTNVDLVITAGTVDGVSVVGEAVASFSIEARSALRPATAGRTLVVDAAGLADANMVKLGPSGSGTAQTARDIGASVLLSSGAGTGQLDFTAGVVKANATQWVGGAIPAVNVTGVPLVDLKYTLGTISPAAAGSVRADAVTGAVGSVTGAVGSVTGAVGSVAGNVGGNVVGSVASVTARVTANTDQLAGQTVTAAAGVTFPTSVASPTNITAGTITTATNVTNDVGITQAGADKVWGSAARTLTSFGTLVADVATAVWGAATRILTAGTNIVLAKGVGVTGFNDLDAAGVRGAVGLASANLDVQLAALDADVMTRLAASSYTAPPSATTIASAVWEEPLVGHATAGTAGKALNSAASAGDPWATALPGSYAAGTAGNIVGNRLDAAVSSRSTYAGADTAGTTTLLGRPSPLDAAGTRAALGLASANLDTQLDALPTTAEVRTQADAALAAVGVTTIVTGRIDAAVSSRSTYAGADTAGTTTLLGRLTATRAGNLDNLDAAVSTRLPASTYVAPDNAGIASAAAAAASAASDAATAAAGTIAIFARTDVATSTRAAPGDVPTPAANADGLLARNIAGGSDGVRTVSEAMRALRNRTAIVGGTLTVYEEDDTTASWTAAIIRAPSDPLTAIDPA